MPGSSAVIVRLENNTPGTRGAYADDEIGRLAHIRSAIDIRRLIDVHQSRQLRNQFLLERARLFDRDGFAIHANPRLAPPGEAREP